MLKARQPGMVFIFITILIDVIGLGIIIPVLPDLIASLTHTTITEAATWGGWLIGVYAFMQFFFSPMMGAFMLGALFTILALVLTLRTLKKLA